METQDSVVWSFVVICFCVFLCVAMNYASGCEEHRADRVYHEIKLNTVVTLLREGYTKDQIDAVLQKVTELERFHDDPQEAFEVIVKFDIVVPLALEPKILIA